MKSPAIEGPEYTKFLAELEARITSARVHAVRAMNRDLILLYWDIGRAIVEKQQTHGWGQAVVEVLARDLQRSFPSSNSFSPDNLWRMRQFFTTYSDNKFLGQAVPESLPAPSKSVILGQSVPETSNPQQALVELLASVPWGHNLLILKKAAAPSERLFYLRATAHFGWSRNVLLNQLKAGAYERSLADRKTNNFPAVLPEQLAEQATETFKSSYCLEFLGIHREIKERELEDRLVQRLQEFILELGYGFCFIGRQYRLTLGQKEYFLDLLFYHRFLKALVAFELKVGSFEPEYTGKMDFYLNLLNSKERGPGDNPSIGIILCAEKDDVEVEYALKTKTNPIGVVAYQLQSKLPGDLKGKLPTARQLSDVVRSALPKRAN